MLFPSFKEGRVRIEFPCMENNLLFFHFIEEEEQDILSFGYLLYSPSFSLISSGKKTNPHDILDLIEENIPICYDLLYFSADILSLYEKDGRPIDWDKKYFDLYALYKYKRHLHFYVDIFDCLTHLGLFHKTVDSNFDVEDADAKDMARLSRVIFEDFSLKYDGSSTGVLNGRLGWSDLRRQKKIGESLDEYADDSESARYMLSKSKKNKFLFFDIECSNTDYCEGKICEFSYCLFDSNFKLLEKKEILINPGEGEENDFKLLGRSDSRDLHLQYEENDYKAYRESPTFDKFMDEIEALLFDEDTIVLGYEVESDLRFLSYSFSRYERPLRNLVAIDVKRVYEEILSRGVGSLGDLVSRYVPSDEAASLRFHSALDDAYATGLVLKYFLLIKEIDFKTLFKDLSSDVVCLSSYAFSGIPELIDDEVYERLLKDGLL